jgi:hypothetical protein
MAQAHDHSRLQQAFGSRQDILSGISKAVAGMLIVLHFGQGLRVGARLMAPIVYYSFAEFSIALRRHCRLRSKSPKRCRRSRALRQTPTCRRWAARFERPRGLAHKRRRRCTRRSESGGGGGRRTSAPGGQRDLRIDTAAQEVRHRLHEELPLCPCAKYIRACAWHCILMAGHWSVAAS